MSDITHIKQLTSDPKNARKHTPRNVGMIEKGMGEVGAARSIVIDENGVVLAGNATIEAAQQAGITKVQVIDGDGNTLIAVQRKGLTDEQKTKLALYDNRTAELAGWDVGVLADTDPLILENMFFPHELAAILEQGATEMLTADDLWKGMPDFEQEDQTAYKRVVVNFTKEDDYQEFFRLVGQRPNAKAIWIPPQENVKIGTVEDAA